MKIVQQEFRVSTKSRNQMIDITSQVSDLVGQSGVTDGDAIVYCPHTTAAITINENADPSVQHDILTELNRIASHLFWLGTHALDIGAMTVFLYAFREREDLMDCYEAVSGTRMHANYYRPGGVYRDLPETMPRYERYQVSVPDDATVIDVIEYNDGGVQCSFTRRRCVEEECNFYGVAAWTMDRRRHR